MSARLRRPRTAVACSLIAGAVWAACYFGTAAAGPAPPPKLQLRLDGPGLAAPVEYELPPGRDPGSPGRHETETAEGGPGWHYASTVDGPDEAWTFHGNFSLGQEPAGIGAFVTAIIMLLVAATFVVLYFTGL